jgi:hypothetical protein
MGEEIGDPMRYMNATTGGLFLPFMSVAFAVLVGVMCIVAIVWYLKPDKEAEARIAKENAERETPIIWNQLG